MKDKLTRSGAILETLRELIKKLININDKWYKRSIERRHDRGYRRIGFISRNIN